jgi:nicotinamidase/pyrazinamidase
VRKGRGGEDGYSGFSVRDPETGETSSTELEALLRDHAVERLVIVGLATDYCVVETALDARTHGFGATVVEEAIRAVDLKEGDGARAIERMRHAGVDVLIEDGAPTHAPTDGPGPAPSGAPEAGQTSAPASRSDH